MNLTIYLDESGDLGLDFEHRKTSRYLVIGLLVFLDGASGASHKVMLRAVKRTLENKLPRYTNELKGNKLTFPIKKYFLKEMEKGANWRLYMAVADKKSWVSHHTKHNHILDKKALYDEIARRIFFHVDGIEKASSVDLIVDRSKKKSEIAVFDQIIIKALSEDLLEIHFYPVYQLSIETHKKTQGCKL